MKLQSISVAQARLITEECRINGILQNGHLSLDLGQGVVLTATKEGLVLSGDDDGVDNLWDSIKDVHWVEHREQSGVEFLVVYSPSGDYMDTVEETTQIIEVTGGKPFRIEYK